MRDQPLVLRLLPLLCALSVVLALGFVTARLWRVETSIVAFLPVGDDRELFEVSQSLVDSTLTRRMVLTVGGPEGSAPQLGDPAWEGELAEAAATLARELARSPRVRRVERGVDEGLERALFDTYFPRRYHFWSLSPEEDKPLYFSDDALDEAATKLRDALGGPEVPFVRQLAPRDPLQLFPGFLRRLEAQRPRGLEVRDGQFFSRDGHAILLIELADSPFDGTRQRELLTHLEGVVASLPPTAQGALRVEASGVNRFAVTAEEAMKRDLSRISVLSVAGLLLLFTVLFRRPARLLFTFAPVAFGVLVGAAASLLLRGELHVLTLAFGSALIGVAIDYPVHMANHHDLSAGRGEDTRRRVRPSLLWAGSTTTLGLMALGVAGFPGVRDMALFASAGIFGALVATLWLARWLGPAGSATPLQRRWATRLAALLERGRGKGASGARWALGLVALGAAGGLGFLNWNNDLESLHQPSPELVAEDARVQERIGQADAGRFVVARGHTLEEALTRHEAMLPKLKQSLEEGALSGYTSVDPVLRSAALQEQNAEAVLAEPRLIERSLAALESADFVPEAFEPFVDELRELGKQRALTFEELEQGPLAALAVPFVALPERGAQHAPAVVSHLQGVHQPESLRAAVESAPGVRYFDRRQSLDESYRNLRNRTAWLLLVGVTLMALLAFGRYRSLRRGLAAVGPSWASGAVTFGLLSALGVELGLLHVVALLLVLGVGVDYGIFLVDAGRQRATAAAVLSIVMACASTVLSFGLLALSSMPALRAIGQTVAVGVVANALLAPLMLMALRLEEGTAHGVVPKAVAGEEG